MQFRTSSRLAVPVSEIGFGMWGMGGWTGSDDDESSAALDRAVELGCNFFDTAWAYGDGHSERLLGALMRRHPRSRLVIASKVPPMNRQWPGRASTPADEVFPYEHVVDSTHATLENLGVEALDLQQLHVWDDSWAEAEWLAARHTRLEADGNDSSVRHQRESMGASQRLARARDRHRRRRAGRLQRLRSGSGGRAAARVPPPRHRGHRACAVRRGSLTGTLTPDARWPDGDWRNIYFAPPHLADTLPRVEAVRHEADLAGMPLPELALRFILSNPAVTTTIPGMRRVGHVAANMAAAERHPLGSEVIARLRRHRWDRLPDGRP